MKALSYTDEQLKWILENGSSELTWAELAEEFEKEFGIKKTGNAIRKTYSLWEGHEFSNDEMLKNIRSAHSAKKQKGKVAKENRLLLDYLDQQEELLEKLEQMLKSNKIGKVNIPKVKRDKKKRDLGIERVLTDIHVGLRTKSYNTEKCEKAMAYSTQVTLGEIERLKKNYNVTDFQLSILGDIIQGNNLHGADSQASCELSDSEQVVEAIRIIFYTTIVPIAKTGINLNVTCLAGNHDRQSKDRPVVDAGKRYLSWIIYNMLDLLSKQAGLTNVNFQIPVKEYSFFEMFGSNYILEHGHAAGIKPNVNSLESQLLKRANQLSIIAHGIRIGHFHGSLNANRGRHIIGPSPVTDDCYGDHLGYVSYPAQLLNYYVRTNSRESSYYYSFEIDLSNLG